MKIAHDLQPIELQYYSLDERLNEANKRIMRLPELGILRREFAGSTHRVPVCFGLNRMSAAATSSATERLYFGYTKSLGLSSLSLWRKRYESYPGLFDSDWGSSHWGDVFVFAMATDIGSSA